MRRFRETGQVPGTRSRHRGAPVEEAGRAPPGGMVRAGRNGTGDGQAA